jgi:hypothetical protein
MAKVDIKFTGLSPNQKYRLVISPKDDAITKFSVPSVSFTTPKAPNRLDLSNVYVSSIASSAQQADTITGTTPVSIYHPSVVTRGTISYWVANIGTYDYRFTTNDASSISNGDHFIVDGISTPPTEYYDQLYYTVTGKSGNVVYVRASYVPSFRQFIVNGVYTNSSSFAYSDGRALSNKDNPNAANWTNVTAPYYTTSTQATNTAVYGKYAILNVYNPPTNLTWTNTVKDVPVFMFEWNNKFYYLSNTVNIDTSTPDRVKGMWGKYTNQAFEISAGGPINYTSSSSVITASGPSLSAVHYLGIENIRPKYYFTIARYIKDSNGTDWIGSWLQKKVGYDLYQTIDYVIKAGEAT